VRRGIIATLRTFPRVSRPLTVALGGVMVLSALTPTAFIFAAGAVVGTLPRAIAAGPGSGAAHRVLLFIGVAGVIFVFEQTTGPLLRAVSAALGRRLTTHLRHRVMAASVLPPGIAHLEDPVMLDKVSLAQGVGADMGPRELAVGIGSVGVRYMSAILSTIVLAFFSWWLALALFGAYALVMRRLRREFQKSTEVLIGEAQNMRRSDYYRDAALTPAAAKESRVFGLGDWWERRFGEAWGAAITEARRERRGMWQTVLWMPAVFFVTQFVAFVILGRAAVRGEITLGEFSVFTGAAFGIGTLTNLSQDDLFLQYGAPSVLAVLELEEAVEDPQLRLDGDRSAAALPRDEIRFDDVTFRYPGQERTVLDGLNLTIAAGRSLAIVGDNGAGKTTLVKLLARLYDPVAGRISADGFDLRDLDAAQWQQRIGAIFQDFVRYQLSAIDNVGFGATVAADGESLMSAAARAGVLEMITELPASWDTVLSRQFSGGADLSGGQWQKIALARALFAVERGAGVLVLDEPTANLDVRAEAELYDRFIDLTRGLTTILISHRFSTVRRADRIVVLEAGRVVEDGTHDELLAAGGTYAHMFGLQAARFVP
jgi:ATP-binding cassette subfamily B protein